MEPNEKREKSDSWIMWLMLFGLSGAFGIIFGFVLMSPLALIIEDSYLANLPSVNIAFDLAFGAIFGLVTGVASGMIFREQIKVTIWWVLASIIGWSMSMALKSIGDNLLNLSMSFNPGEIIFGFISGAFVGVVQWLVIRQYVPRFGWWVLLSAVGWGIGWGMEIYLKDIARLVLSATLGTTISGLTLWWLLRQNDPIPSPSPFKGEL